MPRHSPWFARPAVLVLIFVSGLVLGWSGVLPNPISRQPAGVQREFVPFWQAWRLVEEHYVDHDAVKPEKMRDGAIRGMLDTLGDTDHTTYLTREEAERAADDLAGHMEGIGVHISMRQGRPVVVAVVPDSPAQRPASGPATCCNRWTARTSRTSPRRRSYSWWPARRARN